MGVCVCVDRCIGVHSTEQKWPINGIDIVKWQINIHMYICCCE